MIAYDDPRQVRAWAAELTELLPGNWEPEREVSAILAASVDVALFVLCWALVFICGWAVYEIWAAWRLVW